MTASELAIRSDVQLMLAAKTANNGSSASTEDKAMNHQLQRTRAQQAWPVLVRQARAGGPPLTYGALCSILGVNPRVASYFLGKIQTYCRRHRLPPLQALAVNARTRLPGPGYNGSARTRTAHFRALQRVYAHAWPIAAPAIP